MTSLIRLLPFPKKLYKKKGDKTKLQNFRFIHLKDWAAKVMEKLTLLLARPLEKVAKVVENVIFSMVFVYFGVLGVA